MVGRTRVLVVDEKPLIRDALTKILSQEPDIIVVGESAGTDIIEQAVNLQPDIVLLDIVIHEVDCQKIIQLIRDRLPDTRIIALTDSDSEDDLFLALRMGAQGYLLKNSAVDRIIDGVRKVAAGETVLSPKMVGKLAFEVKTKNDGHKLSTRESQVLGLIRDGKSNTEIAGSLSLEESTVKTHVHHLLGKLGVKNRTEAAFYARRHLV